MKNKSDKYLDLAKEVRLAHVPNKGKEAESLLNSTKSGTAQNIFTRIFNYFGRHLIMTFTSLIALIVAGVLLNNPQQNDNEQATAEVLREATEKNYAEEYNKAAYFTYIENTSESKSEKSNILKDTTINKDEHFELDDLTWELVKFNQENWSFQYIEFRRNSMTYDKNGDSSASVNTVYDDFEEKHLIPIEKQLEDSIKSLVDINRIKSICNLEIDDYFMELANLGKKISKYDNSDKLIKMANLYAHINRKFLKNPAEEMKIKSKGIILPKETLESLGISFSDSTVTIPQDDYFKAGNYRNHIIDWYGSEIITSKNLPDKDIILKKNIIYEWTRNLPQHDSSGKINWYKIFIPAQKRIMFPTHLMGVGNVRNMIRLQSYFDLLEIKDSKSQARLCPLILKGASSKNYHDLVLKNTNKESNQIYKYFEKIYTKWKDERIKTNNISDKEYFVANTNFEKQKVIFDNMLASYKYRYLIPVDIQLPYYNLSKKELDALDYYESITLWYYPSEEFLSKLPEDIREQLEKEIQLVEDVQKGELQPEEACAEVGNEESLLGLCNLTDKAIANLKVYPNPARDFINISFELLDTRYYKIILTDLTGNYVQDLTDWTEENEGEIRYNHNLANMENGTYLVQVITEKSEKLLGKFILKK